MSRHSVERLAPVVFNVMNKRGPGHIRIYLMYVSMKPLTFVGVALF